MNNSFIYLDNNATTQIDERVLNGMLPFLTQNFANANSTHHFGLGAYEAVKKARQEVADLLGAEVNEVIFTSGSTESINLAIKGVAENYSTKGKHIITVQTEHSAILDTCRHLESKGFSVTYLPVNSEGQISLQNLKECLSEETILVSVMAVNNETGVIQPIRDIASLAHSVGALFMTDATQGVGKMPIDVNDSEIDLLCFSGHKIHAPKGVGVLFIRQRLPNRVKIPAMQHGGGHERGMRSGTLNVPGIVGLGLACNIAKAEMKTNAERIGGLRDYLESELLKIEGTKVNGGGERLYNVTNILFSGIDSDAMIMGLSNPDNNNPMIAVSNGSACTSTSMEPSHVLSAMGLDETSAFSSLRFSLSKYNTHEELETAIIEIKRVMSELKLMTGAANVN